MEQGSDISTAKVQEFVRGFFWMLPNLLIAAAVLVAFLVATWIVHRAVRGVFRRRGRENLGELVAQFARWGVVFLGVLVIAAIVFPSIKPADLLSTLGVGSIAIGFAFKDILQNWMAGLLILWRQPFRRGDQIVVGKFEGTVEHIEARATLITTYDGRRVVIPNNDVYATSVIVNTAFPSRRSETDIGLALTADLRRARDVTLEAMKTIDGVLPQPAPELLAWELGESTLNARLRWWTGSKRTDVVHTKARVIERVTEALNQAGIDLPFPTRTIDMRIAPTPEDETGASERETPRR